MNRDGNDAFEPARHLREKFICDSCGARERFERARYSLAWCGAVLHASKLVLKGEIMSDMGVQPWPKAAPESAGLTQWQRVTNTFTAPSKTFEDIKRGNRSWWLPLIIGAILSYMLFGAIVQKIGMQQVVDNQIRMDPKSQERMAKASPEQREMGNKIAMYALPRGSFVARTPRGHHRCGDVYRWG